MLFFLLSALITLALGEEPPLPIFSCGFSSNYIGYVLLLDTEFTGLNFTEAVIACDFVRGNLVNVSPSNFEQVFDVLNQCNTFNSSLINAWIGAYNGVASPYGCSWLMYLNSGIFSNFTFCQDQDLAPVICQINNVVFTTDTSSTVHATEIVFDDLTITDTFTTFTTTTTTRPTLYTFTDSTTTVTVTKRPHDHRKDEVMVENNFVQCPFSSDNFHIVLNSNPLLNETANDACAFFGYQLANITTPILLNLNQLFENCNVFGNNYAAFVSINGYEPLCALANNNTVQLYELSSPCALNSYAICHFGPPIITTITVNTDPTTVTFPVVVTDTTLFDTFTFTDSTSTTVILTDVSYSTTKTFTNIHTVTNTRC